MTVTTIAPRFLVEAPTRQPLPYGLFSVLNFRPDTGHWEAGAQFETITCDPVGGIGEVDCDPPATIGLPKDILDRNAGDIGEASPFTLYGHYTCSTVGNPWERAQTKAADHLRAREEQRAEQALWTGDLGNVPNLSGANGYDAPTVLTASANPLVTLGKVEHELAQLYGSQGVIHMNRLVAALLGDALITSGGVLRTRLGTPVVAGSGYPDATTIIGSPALFGYRSDVFYPSTISGDTVDRRTNELYTVAERNYLIGMDPCGLVSANITGISA